MSKPWEKLPDESRVWHDRFESYLRAGPTRDIADIWRNSPRSNRGAPTSGQPEPGTKGRKPSGAWYAHAKNFSWASRAEAYDQDQQTHLRQAHLVALRKTNERHQQLATTAFLSLARGITSVKWDKLSPDKYVSCLEKLINLQRLIMGAPISVEEIRTTEAGARSQEMRDALDAGVADGAKTPFTPDFMAKVFGIMERHGAPVTQDDQPAEDGTGPAVLAVSEPFATLTRSEGVPIC